MTDDDVERVLVDFDKEIRNNADIPYAIAAVDTLLSFLKLSHADTMTELQKKLSAVISKLIARNISVSVESGCELFIRFITLTSIDQPDFEECKKVLIQRGEKFVNRALKARHKIAQLGQKFIKNSSKILIHSKSRVVFLLLTEAMKSKKNFHVYITESRPNMAGVHMKKNLEECGIPTTLIVDSAVGYVMEQIDTVIVGAEGVVESGGILNKIGTYQISMMANHKRVPVYVVAESFKFIRFFPLKQRDVPNRYKYENEKCKEAHESCEHPLVDYTPPEYISLLVTDLGVLTPSAVSDELIKLYM